MTRPHDHNAERARYGLCLTCSDAGSPEAVAPAPATQLPIDGLDQQALDLGRLTGQALRIAAALADGRWRTLAELAAETGDPEASVSARLRDLRRPEFGGHRIDRRRLTEGAFAYRLRTE